MKKLKKFDSVVESKVCNGCHACFNACPVHALKMEIDQEGFWYPEIDNEICIKCGKCEKVCPIINIPQKSSIKKVYGCYANNEKEHMSSSSGGFFAVLARKILECGGVVSGAAYNDECTVQHMVIESEEDLCLLKETKYVQSKIGDTYFKVEQYLKNNRFVLFSGTPCQIAGLKNYLGKEYDTLLCVDLICHGVPSPGIWKKYLNEITNGEVIRKVTFRDKEKGISNVTLDYFLKNGQVIKENYGECLYIKGFIKNVILRPSCFECRYKGIKRCSDITMGDFWAIDEFHKGFSNGYGVSSIIVHSEKGEYWLKQLTELEMVMSSIEEVSCWNTSLISSPEMNKYRVVFFEDLKSMSVIDALKKNTAQDCEQKNKGKLLSRIKGRMRRWLA